MNGFKDLEIYKRSYRAAKAVREMTKDFPDAEKHAMVSQMQRASLGIPMNIAEGYAKRESQAEFKRFLKMAYGSASEMQVLIDFAYDVSYIEENQHKKAMQEYVEISKMLNAFISSVAKKETEHPKI